MESFTRKTVLLSGASTVSRDVVADQEARARDLKELVIRAQEEFFNVFELVPQTAQDIYFSKIAAGTLKTAIVSSSDDLVDKEVQTEEIL